MSIGLKRVYDKPARSDGTRVLVDRLWPRGIKKADALLDAWTKEAAPSSQLRRWFGHEEDKWHEFTTRYFKELDEHPKVVEELISLARDARLTLLFASKDSCRNNAVALKEYLETKQH